MELKMPYIGNGDCKAEIETVCRTVDIETIQFQLNTMYMIYAPKAIRYIPKVDFRNKNSANLAPATGVAQENETVYGCNLTWRPNQLEVVDVSKIRKGDHFFFRIPDDPETYWTTAAADYHNPYDRIGTLHDCYPGTHNILVNEEWRAILDFTNATDKVIRIVSPE